MTGPDWRYEVPLRNASLAGFADHAWAVFQVMIGVLLIGVVTSLAVFAILTNTCEVPKKAEKWEKVEIIKQLLALSDNENSRSAVASPQVAELL